MSITEYDYKHEYDKVRGWLSRAFQRSMLRDAYWFFDITKTNDIRHRVRSRVYRIRVRR
jgi:hypothetical protein